MDQILGHFELPRDAKYLSEVARSPVLARYSKAAEFEYSPQIRTEVLNESRQRNREEIRKGLNWLESLARSERVVAGILG
jgi:membrane carboxypeptidase/penicillin-binding protein